MMQGQSLNLFMLAVCLVSYHESVVVSSLCMSHIRARACSYLIITDSRVLPHLLGIWNWKLPLVLGWLVVLCGLRHRDLTYDMT